MTDEEPKLVFSPLCRRIKRKRSSVRVHIYRLERDNDWTLEVEDQAGGSTVWDEKFLTDEAALEEVMKVIETEGIDTFLVDQDKPTLH
jgi:C4-type Zn-finger protein